MNYYLVTGGAGFIGYWLTKKLAENPTNEVWVVDNNIKTTDTQSFENLITYTNVKFLKIDLSLDNLDEKLPKINFDIIYHLAAFNGTQNFYNRPFEVIFHSTLSTLNLLKWCEFNKPGRFVFSSTSEAYAGGVSSGIINIPTSEKIPLLIDDITNPRWSYASAKLNGESAVISANVQYKINYTIIRYHNIYGPRMGVNHIIPDYLNRVNAGIFELYGSMNTRSFLFIDDAVNDTIELARSDKSKNEIVNIGSSEEITMKDLALEINKLLKINENLILFEAPAGSVNRRLPCLQKNNSILGTRERVSLENGLLKTIEYYAI
jgi:nucleoside-diphosphate-sugar epimerase